LAVLAPHLDRDQLSEVLAMTRQIKEEWIRAEVLAKLAPYLGEADLPELYTLLLLFLDLDKTLGTISILHERWNDLLKSSKKNNYELLTEVISRYAQSERKTLLEVINILLPQFKQLGGTPLLLSIFNAIRKTATWWP
jgi:hypothetical protein